MPGKLVVVIFLIHLISAAQAGSTSSGASQSTAASQSPSSASTAPSTAPSSPPTSPRTTALSCSDNTTVLESCLKNGLGLNMSQIASTSNYTCLVGGSQCNSTTPVSTCSANITANSTYGLLCTSSGLFLYRLSASSCPEISSSTEYMCQQVLPLKKIQCTGSYNGQMALNSEEATNVSTILASSCAKPKSTPLPLLPNPVGPEAITAIVVITCLTITAILAGFFFWPKCHITNPAAEAVKQATKPQSARAASASAAAGAVSKSPPAVATVGGAAGTGGGNSAEPYNVKYDGNRNAASIKVSSLPGPSAA